MKLLKIAVLSFFCFLILHSSVYAQDAKTTTAQARVLKIEQTGKTNQETHREIKKVTLEINAGSLKGKTVTAMDNEVPSPTELHYKVGDNVIISYAKGPSGEDILYITDVARQPSLLLLTLIFVVLAVVVARWQGVSSLIGMAISFFIIGKFIIPNILLGNNPILITFFGALFIIPLTFYISHGLNKKTTIAIVGTFITLILITALSFAFINFAQLTGLSSEESVFLQNMTTSIDFKSLLLAGIMIAVMAVLNDITISQASIVTTLFKSKPSLTMWQLYTHAMEVGKDHVASLVNTLILVYAGASLPLFLLFYTSQGPFSLIVNQELVATEVIRTLVSSIGIIAAVPITTYLACLAVKNKLF